MTDIKNEIKLYLSHPVRGSFGSVATTNEQLSNSGKAKKVAFEIMTAIPHLDLYVPGAAEDFVVLTFTKGLLTDEQIIEIDCEILEKRDGLLVYTFDKSTGVDKEIKKAKELGKPIYTFTELNSRVIEEIKVFVKEILKEKYQKKEEL